MKALIFLALAALPAFGQLSLDCSQNGMNCLRSSEVRHEKSFAVKELSPATARSIDSATANLERATKEVEAAQAKADEARKALTGIEATVRQENKENDNPCRGGLYMGGTKEPYRHIEIRGKYVLISEGEETCPSNVSPAMFNGADSNTIAVPVDSNVTIDHSTIGVADQEKQARQPLSQ